MSRILCPECGSKISDKATTCPHCGFRSADPKRPISEQDKYEVIPVFEYDVEEWNPNRSNPGIISYEDNKSLVMYFGKWEIIQTELPAIAEVISAMAGRDHIMIAKMDSYIRDLIDKGIYRFTIDKQGEILPTIRDAEGIVKQVRLEDKVLSPNLLQSLNNLSTNAAMV
ncbi:MAG: zinc ribbon domain-containing protein [Clostridiales bacterium]|nr:zinc ribbon domain-containing protein [Clostridiales bacterium]